MKLLLTTIKGDNPSTELALKYLYGIVADSPLETATIEFENNDLDYSIYEEIVRGQYNIVYFYCDEFNEHRITNIVDMVKKANPSLIVVVGGMQVSFSTRDYMLANPCVDYVIRGEGETVLFNFLRTLITYEYDFDMIPGLAYRTNGEIIVNPFDAVLQMEELPFPYEKSEIGNSKVVYYETIRGTSDRTAYAQFMPDARVRSLSLSRICTELRYFLVKGVERVVIIDRFFNYNVERAYRIFEYIINNDNGIITFELNINGDNLDDETIRLLSEARDGLFVFNIDIVSTNAETLASIGRDENVYQMMYNLTKLFQRNNIKIQLSITAGLPLETEALFARSFNKAYGLGDGSSLRVNMLTLPKGSALRDEAAKFAYVYRKTAPFEVLGNAFMQAGDLINVKAIAKYTGKYVNGKFSASLAKMLNDTGKKPYTLFKEFAEFVFRERLDDKMNKEENLYRVLYKFATSIYDEDEDALKLQILKEVIHGDMEKALPADAVKKFERKGWDIDA